MNSMSINEIYKGDCFDLMKKIRKESVNLIYLDPPFFTKKIHKLKNRQQNQEFFFEDQWESEREYLEFLSQRIELMSQLLKSDGSIFVHCDKSGEHLVRTILNRIFGEKNFQSEIIWSYKRWSNSKKGLLPNHQNIYFYSKSKHFKFNTIYTDYSEATNLDQILQRRTKNSEQKSIYARDSKGNCQLGGPKKGVPLSDVWEIPYLNPKAKERVGYPTQKPLILLERILSIATNPGDLVLDPFCGSGTTCVAAKGLSLNFIGIDKSKEAVLLTKERLKNPIRTESKLLKKGRESYRNATQEALSLLNGIPFHPVQRNKGIDAILVEFYKNRPVLVRVQKEGETLLEAIQLLLKAQKTKKSEKVILIQTCKNSEKQVCGDLNHKGLEIIQTPALQIEMLLKKP